VDNQYQKERQRLLTKYFPVRSEQVLKQVIAFTGIDPTGIQRLDDDAISPSDDLYDLSGRKLSIVNSQLSIKKGIYILNGRKIVVR
jgi:hypothetical protein